MDREGFSLIDKQYRLELIEARRKATEKWDAFYSKKQYVGSHELQSEARKHDQEERQKKIHEDFLGYQKRIGTFHFGQGGRDAAFEKLQKQESANQNEKNQQQREKEWQQRKEQEHKFQKETGAKSVFELARKIVEKQENKNLKRTRKM